MSKMRLYIDKIMKYKQKDQLFFWGMVFLTLLNISALATICYHKMGRRHHPPPMHEFAPPTASPKDAKKLDKYGERMQKRVNKHLQKALDLTGKQADTFWELQKTHFVESSQLKEKMQENKSALFEKVKDGSINPKTLDRLADKIGDAQSELAKVRVEHILSMKEVCNEEQATKLLNILEHSPLVRQRHHGPPHHRPKHDKHGKHHRKHGHHHPPPHHGHHPPPPPPPPPHHRR